MNAGFIQLGIPFALLTKDLFDKENPGIMQQRACYQSYTLVTRNLVNYLMNHLQVLPFAAAAGN